MDPAIPDARQLSAAGALGRITPYRGQFFSMYGADPLGQLTWRFLTDQGGHGVSTDLLSHAVDLAHFLVGPIERELGLRVFLAGGPDVAGLQMPGATSLAGRTNLKGRACRMPVRP